MGNRFAQFSGRLEEFAEKLKKAAAGFAAKAALVADRLADRIPEEKRKLVLLCSGGTVFLLIIITGIFLARAGRLGEGDGKDPLSAFGPEPAIPGDELFLPGEPDFVPEFLLEKEPRHPWTARDLEPFWKDPLGEGRGLSESRRNLWREEMSAVLDEILEAVP
jgi:hypothetical protein